MKLERLFSRQWWKTTLIVIAAVMVMVRLGFWQLDRLTQRRAFNARVEEQLAGPPLILSSQKLDLDLYNMEYRDAVVSGEYDFDRQVVLRNQDWQGRLGVHILTPMMIEGGKKAILVDRGWVPFEDFTGEKLSRYDVHDSVEVDGVIRRSQSKPAFGGRADQVPEPGEEPLVAWYWINLKDISQQLPYELLPVYLVSSPDFNEDRLPYRSKEELDLSEGSHLGYAFQWFTFAAILGFGYPIYVRKEERQPASKSHNKAPYIKDSNPSQPAKDSQNEGYEKA